MTFLRIAFKMAWDGKGSIRSAVPDEIVKLGNVVPVKDNGDGTWTFEFFNDDNAAYSSNPFTLAAAQAKLSALGISVVVGPYVGKPATVGKFGAADGSDESG